MAEIEGLKVIISAEIKTAIANLQKVHAQFSKLGNIFKKESINMIGFLNKFKLGWAAVGTAAIASLYSLAKTSAYMSMWFEEATGIVSYFADSALAPLSPIIETVLDWFWKLADFFNKFPDGIKGVIGALALLGSTMGTFLSGFKILDLIFGTDFAAKLLTLIKGAFTAVGSSILGAIAAGVGIGLTVVWILDQLHVWDALAGAGREIEAKVPTLFNLLKILTAPLAMFGSIILNLVRGDFNKIIPDLQFVWDESFGKVINYVTNTIGVRIQNMLHNWSTTLHNWSKGLVGFSPTLTMIGQQIPNTIMSGAEMNPVSVGNIVNSSAKPSMNSGGSTINFSPTINITGAQIKSDMDIRQLANQLTVYWKDDMQRYVRGVR